jgi:flagellar operon protein
LTDEQMLKLQDGVKSASAKGIKESLVLMDDIALVVNIENKTVVTALSRQESKEHVFTNIDGAEVK